MLRTAAPLPTWNTYRMILAGLILAAWLIIVIWAVTPYAVLLDHHEIEEGGFSAFVRWPAFIGGWTLMVIAMMLPGSLPAVKAFMQAAAASGAAPGRNLGAYLLGYLVVWVAFGVTIYLGDTLLHGAIDARLAPEGAAGLIPVALLTVAGLYQFTPVRRSCRAKRALPEAPDSAALHTGLRAGSLCLGTCGGTMLVMFALGGGVNLLWMAALTALTLVERTTPVGRYLAWLLGLALLLWAALLFAGQWA